MNYYCYHTMVSVGIILGCITIQTDGAAASEYWKSHPKFTQLAITNRDPMCRPPYSCFLYIPDRFWEADRAKQQGYPHNTYCGIDSKGIQKNEKNQKIFFIHLWKRGYGFILSAFNIPSTLYPFDLTSSSISFLMSIMMPLPPDALYCSNVVTPSHYPKV